MAVFGSIIGLTAYIAGQNLIQAPKPACFLPATLVYIPLAIWLRRPSMVMILAVVVIALGVFITSGAGGGR